MHPERRKRALLLIVILIIVGAAAGLVMYALRQNINLFYSPTQIQSGEAPINVTIRAGGMVEKNSVVRESEGLKIRFSITDYASRVTVIYNGILPDLFREEQGIVARGKLTESGEFLAEEVLAKHDENYMPPEVSDALKSAKSNDQRNKLEGK
ncbi:cytochrome c maturation protein CcmE [Marinomonas balearica]|uniref:Cytochrome c-type biogenesis protein CcmE n=1 Tax=Marinomonas balearica TaxID=491947 RepID=A0A4R6MA68_9GAMM|nr:cytochrome c maturation protein CcmE [Marinomonas balearica]TDO98324.1 cytochrome c-type biogenesis protein CcmE [Marinomonas balearica]